MENQAGLFYEHRQRFNTLLRDRHSDSHEAAALFYYLNRTGYNGLCRFNRSGEFNVPFGRYARIRYATDFEAYQAVFSAWTFSNRDVEHVQVEPEDFIYADPPYDTEFTAYAAGGFSWADQVRTAEWLARHPGPVIAVNQATRRVEQLYRRLGFTLRFLDAPRRISASGDRTPAREMLATRNLPLPRRLLD
jgi:DNA adenine methylase